MFDTNTEYFKKLSSLTGHHYVGEKEEIKSDQNLLTHAMTLFKKDMAKYIGGDLLFSYKEKARLDCATGLATNFLAPLLQLTKRIFQNYPHPKGDNIPNSFIVKVE